MVSDDPEPIHHPFGGFRIRTEAMPDGRRIHYYEWPAGDERDADGDGDGDGAGSGGAGSGGGQGAGRGGGEAGDE